MDYLGLVGSKLVPEDWRFGLDLVRGPLVARGEGIGPPAGTGQDFRNGWLKGLHRHWFGPPEIRPSPKRVISTSLLGHFTHPGERLSRRAIEKQPAMRSLLLFSVLLALSPLAPAQGDPRVMIQGFIWEANARGRQEAEAQGLHGLPHWEKKWYSHVQQQVPDLARAGFDLVWLPPPSEGNETGYFPTQYFVLESPYGPKESQRELLKTLLQNGLEPVADLVLNHRAGTSRWSDFTKPDWSTRAIVENDDFWGRSDTELDKPEDRQARDANIHGRWDTGEGNPSVRDLDHTQDFVRQDIKSYLKQLREFGYRGWRYDQVLGYGPQFVAEYNQSSLPTFSVGEYWDPDVNKILDWVNGTQGSSLAFDFPTQSQLREALNHQSYFELIELTRSDGPGLLGRRPGEAVTFLENHDTGFPQRNVDSFSKEGAALMQGYAFVLTHPGIPCVYWKHYFDWQWGPSIAALVKARKYAGVNSRSFVAARMEQGSYVAEIGDKDTPSSTLVVKIGPAFWQPDVSQFELETSGKDYAVWVRRSMKAFTKAKVDAPRQPLPSP